MKMRSTPSSKVTRSSYGFGRSAYPAWFARTFERSSCLTEKRPCSLQFPDAVHDLIKLRLDITLTLGGHGYLSNWLCPMMICRSRRWRSCRRSVCGSCLKVLFGGNKDIGRGVQLKVFRRPLLGQMLHYEQDFWHRPNRLLCAAATISGFARTHYMGQ